MFEASAGRNHGRGKQAAPADPGQTNREIQVLAFLKRSESAQPAKDIPPHEHGLVTQKPAESRAAPVSEPTGDTEDKRRRVEPPAKRTADTRGIARQLVLENVSPIRRQSRVGMQEEQHIAASGLGAEIHLRGALSDGRDERFRPKTSGNANRIIRAPSIDDDELDSFVECTDGSERRRQLRGFVECGPDDGN
jgi:hypothetical protein